MDNKIYTKGGDKGETSLLGGLRVKKYHLRVESYGTIDELKSYLALIADTDKSEIITEKISVIQEKLFRIEALVACESPEVYKRLPRVNEEDVKYLEDEIDMMNTVLPELNNFIIPGGHLPATHAHVARCICRRAERIVLKLSEEENIEDIIIKYLNRLSDYLFVLARFLCAQHTCNEVLWKTKP